MFRYDDGRVLGDVACGLLCSFLHNETSKSAEVDILILGQVLSIPVFFVISFTISALVIFL